MFRFMYDDLEFLQNYRVHLTKSHVHYKYKQAQAWSAVFHVPQHEMKISEYMDIMMEHKSLTYHGMTLLHFALLKGHKLGVRMLLDKGENCLERILILFL